ncbi:hypothetical protein [Flavobacterium flavipallidum]|uniref:TonB C-terminal domain-containing protein n=1 Tax=Flavobacterium flavipallidum TaxID=3139140 RepID=A0ABU9HPI2_9FLAO
MRNLIMTVVTSLFLTTAIAAEKPSKKSDDYNETYKEITKLLNTYPNLENLSGDVLVKVRIALNENREIVVMSTDTANSDLNYFIKNTLNYKKLSASDLETGNGLIFLVKFTK